MKVYTKIEVEPEILWDLHWGNDYTLQEIGNIFGCGGMTIQRRMKKYDIPRHVIGHRITDFTFNDGQKEIFEGCMLGDGGLALGLINCCFANTDKHKEYLLWLQKQLGVEDISKIRHDNMKYILRTRSILFLREEHKRWYPYETRKGTDQNRHYKIIPEDIELTLTKVLFWYIGDGTYSKRNRIICFTNGLDFDEWSALSKKMGRLLDVNNGISINKQSKNKNGIQKYKLRLNKSVTHRFFDMIDGLDFDIPECYQYKFGG